MVPGRIPARRLAGSEVHGRGKGEEAEANLLVYLVGGEMVRGGLSMVGDGRRPAAN